MNFSKHIHCIIEELRQSIENLQKNAKPVKPENAIGRLTRMEAISDKNVKDANIAYAKKRITLLQQALKRIEEGTFGVCIQCEEEIGEKRLLAVPESTKCIECLNNPDRE